MKKRLSRRGINHRFNLKFLNTINSLYILKPSKVLKSLFLINNITNKNGKICIC